RQRKRVLIMGTYPSAALAIRPPEQPNLIRNISDLLGLKQQLQQYQSGELENQTRALQVTQLQRDQADAQAVQQALAANPNATYGDVLPMLRGKIQPKTWASLVEADQKVKKGYSEQTKDDLANAEAQHKMYGDIYNNVMNLPDQQVAAQWPQIVQAISQVPGNKINLDPNQPLTKQQLSQFGPMLSLNEAYLKGEQEKREKNATIAEKQAQADKAQWEMKHGPITDQSRFIQDYLATNGLADTPANRQKGFGEYNRLTRIQPAEVRVRDTATSANSQSMTVRPNKRSTWTRTKSTMPSCGNRDAIRFRNSRQNPSLNSRQVRRSGQEVRAARKLWHSVRRFSTQTYYKRRLTLSRMATFERSTRLAIHWECRL